MSDKPTVSPSDMDHEQRIYGWLYRVVCDMRIDIAWAMSSKDVPAANAKLQQVINYCNLAKTEADRQMEQWKKDREEHLKALVQPVPYVPSTPEGKRALKLTSSKTRTIDLARDMSTLDRAAESLGRPAFLLNATPENMPIPDSEEADGVRRSAAVDVVSHNR